MDCTYCNIKFAKRKGELEFKSRSLGKVVVPDLQYLECDNCGEKLISPEEGEKAIEFIEKEEHKAVNNLPVGEFVTAGEAAEMLGITKQAFSKNQKIKRGLIYSVKIGRIKCYHRKSIALFKEKNNGKFLLPRQEVCLEKEIIAIHQRKSKYEKASVATIPTALDIFINSDVPSPIWMVSPQTKKQGTENVYH